MTEENRSQKVVRQFGGVLEGTWSLPFTPEQADKLESLMQAPIPANTAKEEVYGLLGDDMLFDSISMAEDADPEQDVRWLIFNRLQEFMAQYDRQFGGVTGHGPFREPANGRAYTTLRRILGNPPPPAVEPQQ